MSGGDAVTFIMQLYKVSRDSEVARNFVPKRCLTKRFHPVKVWRVLSIIELLPKNRQWSRGGKMKVSLTDTKSQEPMLMTIPWSQ